MLLASKVSVKLGEKPILSQVSARAKSGEITAVIGPNGSGKTTLLRTLCGDLKFEGKILYGSKNLKDYSQRQLAKHRAVLSQSASIAFPFTVGEVVALGLTCNRMFRKSPSDHVHNALGAVGLTHSATRFYHELSGGEQQRTHLARVIAQITSDSANLSGKYLFLDEPVSSLDVKYQLEIMQLSRRCAERGACVITILHDLNLAAAYADHFVVMKAGRAVRSGSRQQIMQSKFLGAIYDSPMQQLLDASGEIYILPLARAEAEAEAEAEACHHLTSPDPTYKAKI